MIEVKLITKTELEEKIDKDQILALASHAAKICYEAETPKMGDMVPVDNRLFNPGHHTTLEHPSFTFLIEGISVSDITFGAHLVSPFYNSDQRSGRFCSDMFSKPDFEVGIKKYIRTFWPDLPIKDLARISDFVRDGVEIFHQNNEAAINLTAELITKERPKATDKYIQSNAKKIAQEQLRNFISTAFPTGFDYTLDLIGLVSLYKAAWTPGLVYLTQQMADLVLAKHPQIAYMFSRRSQEWAPKFLRQGDIKFKPGFALLSLDLGGGEIEIPKPEDMHPVDLLHFLPEYMDNSINDIKTAVEISVACMGQDQRHRTIRRGKPTFTGNFYLPPVPAMIPGVKAAAKKTLDKWLKLTRIVPPTLAAVIVPYGAMVSYEKRGSLNAIFHEQHKRLCWCAQEEIYHLSRTLRRAIEKKKEKKCAMLKVLEPHCFRTGICAEGARYCGRDIGLRDREDYFPERKI